jgi:MFS family permease
MNYFVHRPKLADCVFLFAMVLISALPYVFGLGFHGDDWDYHAEFSRHTGESLGRLFLREWTGDHDALVRPVMVAYVVLTHRMSGQHPTPYHLLNTAMLGMSTALLYLALSQMRFGRWLAFSITLVFGLLPHYSTDRFWFASHQATFCMGFALFGIVALLRAIEPQEQSTKTWFALAMFSFTFSVLSYEVAAGLIAGAIALAGWRSMVTARRLPAHRHARLFGIVGVVVALAVVGYLKTLAQHRIASHHHFVGFLRRLGPLGLRAVSQAIQFNLITYGWKMPGVLLSLLGHGALSGVAWAVAAILAACVAVYLWRLMEPSAIPDPRTCIRLIAFGFLVFFLGYAMFFSGLNFNFSSAGINNRVAIASAAGASCILVAIAGFASSLLKSAPARAHVFSLAIAFICAANCLVVSGLGFYWDDAATRQAAVLSSVTANVRPLPQNSVLLLDGFCRFSGPAVVFETDWDTTGAIQLALNDPSVTSEVVSPNMSFNSTSVDTTIYGDPEAHYRYGDRLFVYNVREAALVRLPSREAAADYLRAFNPTGDNGCPPGHEGDGVKIF